MTVPPNNPSAPARPRGASRCRCGYDGVGPHPCHGDGYTCGRPAEFRLYDVRPVALAGMTFKLQGTDTWACDACWEKFQAALRRVHGSPTAPAGVPTEES
jgi:hypothetical protein